MIEGQEVGPITRAEFALRMTHSVVDDDTFVWTQGMSEWLPAAQVEDLALLFKAREKARSAGLRPPPPPAAALGKAKAAAPAPLPAARKPSFQDYSLAAPRSRPGKAAYSGSMPPPFSPENTAQSSEHKPLAAKAVLIPEAPSEATPPLDEQVPLEDSDDEHTTLDLLPLGEQVHQEEVASTLFTSSSGEHSVTASGNTGAVALDEVKFAVESEKKAGIKRLSTSAAPLTTRPSPKPVPAPEPPPARRVPWRLVIAAAAVVAAIGALAFVLR